MSNERPVVFVTGATGFVGRALFKLLSGGIPRHFVLLTRSPEKLEKLSHPGHFSVLPGDITRPHLGLNDQIYAEITEQITEIIHCAADTRFGISLHAAR